MENSRQNNNGRFRKRKVSFAQVSNVALRDPNLSLRAKGLYSLIQSYITIENFTLYKAHLMKQCMEKETAFGSAWNELKNSGYLIQYKLKDRNGAFYYEYELLDEPEKEKKAEKGGKEPSKPLNSPGGDFPPLENLPPGSPTPGEPTPYNNTDLNNTDLSNIKVSQSVIEEDTKQTERQTEELQRVKSILQDQIHIEDLKQSHDTDLVEEIELNILEMYLQDKTTIKGEVKPKSLIQSVISKLNYGHIETLICKFNEISTTTKIKNTKAYIQTMIYNAPFETSASIKNDIKSRGLA